MNETQTHRVMYTITTTTSSRGFNGIGISMTTAAIVGQIFEDYGDAAEAAQAYAKANNLEYIKPGIESIPAIGQTFVGVGIK